MSAVMGPPHEPSEAGRAGKGEAAEYSGPAACGGSGPMKRASTWELPTSLTIGDVGFAINTDFRTVLYVLSVMGDPEYEPDEQAAVCIQVMVRDWERLPAELYQQALEELVKFIDGPVVQEDRRRPRPRTMDWEQDAPLLIPAINRVLGQEVRALPYLHWWTFLGAYMEIGECLFTTVVGIRQKKAKGKKLEKAELEFLRENRALVTLQRKLTAAEREQKNELRELFGMR